MPSKPLLWTLRVLAASSFVVVIAWQVVRRQKEANPPPESDQVPAETHVLGSKSAPMEWVRPEQAKPGQPMFLSGSKSFSGSTMVEGGTLLLPEEKPKKPVFIPSTKVGIESHHLFVDSNFLEEFGVDLDMTPAARRPILSTKSSQVLDEDDFKRKPSRPTLTPHPQLRWEDIKKELAPPPPPAFLSSSKSGALIREEDLQSPPLLPEQQP